MKLVAVSGSMDQMHDATLNFESSKVTKSLAWTQVDFEIQYSANNNQHYYKINFTTYDGLQLPLPISRNSRKSNRGQTKTPNKVLNWST